MVDFCYKMNKYYVKMQCLRTHLLSISTLLLAFHRTTHNLFTNVLGVRAYYFNFVWLQISTARLPT